MSFTDDAVSNFMNELPGYSHLALGKDFRHLQIYHTKSHNTQQKYAKPNVDYNNTASLLKHIYDSIGNYELNSSSSNSNSEKKTNYIEKQTNALSKLSTLMMDLKTNKDFNNKYMKLGLLNQGANGKIYAVKSWIKEEYYAMKEICFSHLSANVMYEILHNYRMVQRLGLIQNETEIYIDTQKSVFLIILHLFKGSMCDLLTETYSQKKRCLNENELKNVLQNGVLHTLKVIHDNGYIHGDIKAENIVYEDVNSDIVTDIIDYDLSILCKDKAVLSEWRGTLGYSAPEWSPQKKIESEITPKVDIFSLGLTLLVLLCGKHPFLCPSAVKQKLEKDHPTINIKQYVYQVMKKDGACMISQFLKQLAPNISVDLYDLLQSMLMCDPQQRIDIEHVMNHKWFN